MNGLLEFGLVGTVILFLLALDLMLWMAGALILLSLLGWHPPGWLASPVAHTINTGMALAGAAMAIAAPILLDMALKHIQNINLF